MERKEGGLEGAGALTRKVLEFQRTGRGLGELVSELSLRIYRFPLIRRGCSEDDCGGFYLFFYPRLIKILSRFRDQGKPFESYLHSVLGWQLRSYVRGRRQEEHRWAIAGRPELWGAAEPPAPGEAGESPPGGEPAEEAAAGGGLFQKLAERLGVDGRGVIRRPADRRRFLLFALKRVRETGEEELERAADRLQMPRAELLRLAGELRLRLARREARLERLRDRRNRAFARLTLLEQQAGEAGEEKARLLEDRIGRLRRRLRSVQRAIARIPLQPSNRDLGEVLGIPKGSVDTSLFWLRRRLEEWQGRQEKEYA